MNVGFIGLGNMGTHMARHLLRAGHEVTVWNRTATKADAHRALGARVAGSPGEAAKASEVVITMLADDAAVEFTALGPGGVSERLPHGSVHVSMSTISVALSKRMAEDHAKRGQGYVAAPVFGRPAAAEAAKLFIVAAGASAALERCRPLLEALGQRVFTLGERPEVANVVKLSGNFLIASIIESLGEAIALARKYGIEPHAYVEFLTGSLFSAPIFKTYGGLIADEQYEPAGFKMRLGLKDVRLALAAAEAVDAPLPIASLIRDRMITALAHGMDEVDWSATAKLAAEDAGLR